MTTVLLLLYSVFLSCLVPRIKVCEDSIHDAVQLSINIKCYENGTKFNFESFTTVKGQFFNQKVLVLRTDNIRSTQLILI